MLRFILAWIAAIFTFSPALAQTMAVLASPSSGRAPGDMVMGHQPAVRRCGSAQLVQGFKAGTSFTNLIEDIEQVSG
jgi:hypothetical protein